MSRHLQRVGELLARDEEPVLQVWLEQQRGLITRRGVVTMQQSREESVRLLAALRAGLMQGDPTNLQDPVWDDLRSVLDEISNSRARLGYSPGDTARFVFSLKHALFDLLREAVDSDMKALGEAVWDLTSLIDALALHTIETHQAAREQIISRQQQELLELSTPVVQLWNGVIALPLIGTLDSLRAQIVMESLLQKIVDSRSAIAIIDITGVPTVDTLVAQHLMKTVAAARLMGADCIISGIRPQIAQTIVHLGVDLSEVSTKATLADAFVLALQRTGSSLVAPAHSH
jgi:rsbT co-antagonist protein RsbR